ncbi:hypothetical protein GSI_10097 [Ganoderma sinense ZZ0214-1]|nr:hypothetical protein GSI_10097 [Ganoderma sinense ZZ0214-1]
MVFIIQIYALLVAGPATRGTTSDVHLVVHVSFAASPQEATGPLAYSGETHSSGRDAVTGPPLVFALAFQLRVLPIGGHDDPMDLDDSDVIMSDIGNVPTPDTDDESMDETEDP